MSADNRICIMEYMGLWHVWHGSLSDEYYEPSASAHAFFSEDEARDFAHAEEERIYLCEGGIQRITAEEVQRALVRHIHDLSRRLNNLLTKGSQYPEASK